MFISPPFSKLRVPTMCLVYNWGLIPTPTSAGQFLQSRGWWLLRSNWSRRSELVLVVQSQLGNEIGSWMVLRPNEYFIYTSSSSLLSLSTSLPSLSSLSPWSSSISALPKDSAPFYNCLSHFIITYMSAVVDFVHAWIIRNLYLSLSL